MANPFGVAVGPDGTIYIADTFNNEIDYVNPNTGVIKVLAGNGTYGDVDGPALSAEFADPRGLALDAPLNLLFIADRDNNVIRELNLATGMVSTVAGTGHVRRRRQRHPGHVRRARLAPRPWRSARPG